MQSRRSFLKQTAVTGLAAASPLQVILDRNEQTSAHSAVGGAKALRTSTSRIKSLIRRDETIVRNTMVTGDNWHLTWAADDRQYTSMCDGFGPFDPARAYYNSRLFAVEGGPKNARFVDVPGYPLLDPPLEEKTRYYNFGVIALDGSIYQFLSTYNVPLGKEVEKLQGLKFIGVKGIYSPDNGRTWCNQDGSTPVEWEDWKHRSKENMLFFDEPQAAFSLLSVLQMGRNYEANRDGFVYVYSPNGSTEGTMNELVMFRVPKTQILNRKAYEYFAGLRQDGTATWSPSIDERGVVHKFPSGWVNKWAHPWAWVPSLSYNAPLGLYMMVNWATGPGPKPKVKWFQRPSYLGFWVAANPWGPWTQVHEETVWTPGGESASRCYSPVISPKWIGADGKSLWLVWTDFQGKLEKSEVERRSKEIELLKGSEQIQASAQLARLNLPYYSFNTQRVDLIVA